MSGVLGWLAWLLFLPLDVLLFWTAWLPPALAVALLGLLTGLGVNLALKHLGDQELMRQTREDLKKISALRAGARSAGDQETDGRLRRLENHVNVVYAWGQTRPALWTVAPVALVALWMGARLAWTPPRPGDLLPVTAWFEDAASGFTHVVVPDGLAVEGPVVQRLALPDAPAPALGGPAAGLAARWLVRLGSPGDHALVLRYRGDAFRVPLRVRARGGFAPEPVLALGAPTPARDGLAGVSLDLAPSVAPAVWNLWLGWVGVYLIVALAGGLGLRRALGVA